MFLWGRAGEGYLLKQKDHPQIVGKIKWGNMTAVCFVGRETRGEIEAKGKEAVSERHQS